MRVDRVAGIVAGGLLMVAAVLAVAALAGVLVVLGGVVVAAGWWAPGLCVAGLVLGAVAVAARRRAAAPARRPAVRVAIVLLAVVAPLVSFVAFLLLSRVDYTVLAPAADGGCRVVVGESSFLFAASGTVHVLGRPGGLAPEVGRYTGDDGYLPVEGGTYDLSWSGDRGVLRLSGDGMDPVYPAMVELGC